MFYRRLKPSEASFKRKSERQQKELGRTPHNSKN